jgi:formylglycine-generating enzyme required for sulfatase activity
MNCGSRLPDGVKFCSECGAKVSASETSPKVTGGMDNSVAVRSPGAGSVYAPSITFGTENEKEKRYCDLCKNEISGRREFAPCTHCGKLMCNICADNYKLRAGNLESPEELCEEYFEPLCWDCWKAVKTEVNRLELDREQARREEERLRREREERERPKTITNTISMEFVLIPVGEFMMGSDDEVSDDDERPVHRVKIPKPFYLGTYPVTQREWKAVMDGNPSEFEGDDLPVESVSWDNVQEFIKKLNEREGTDKYRLPSEAEWEYACRAGTTTRYSFGDSDSKLGEYAWYYGNSDDEPHPAGQKKPNQWGLYDMHGNVQEWVQDTYHENYDGAPADGSAWESGDGSTRIKRRGGWISIAGGCRSADRNYGDHGDRESATGFRLVRDV